MAGDEALLEALNSTPTRDGGPSDLWEEGQGLSQWAVRHGGDGSPSEQAWLRRTRDALQRVVRGESRAEVLLPLLEGVRKVPFVDDGHVEWVVEVETERRLAVELILDWGRIQESSPGRLRACANSECSLFLLDRSRSNTARWCSMRSCGNRIKARRHYARRGSERPAVPDEVSAE
ncbi:CGNR zinc finger domain-containing protein [Streptomyces parvulus]|uniref:CGNR zinc finger domain-containing protein n=1 Tax=Streptomyces parvulus TaxID=146923 RepID=UPI0034495BD1